MLRGVRRASLGLALRGQLLRVLLREVMAGDTAADSADHRMVTRIVPGDSADGRAFQAAGGMSGSGGTECECSGDQGSLDIALFHGDVFSDG